MDKEKIRYTFRVDAVLWKKFVLHCNKNKYQKNLLLESLLKEYLLKIEREYTK